MNLRKTKKPHRVLTKLLLCSSLVLAVESLPTYAANASPQPFSKEISGNHMVYMKYDDDWDVYLYDLQQQGKETKLSNSPEAQGYPAISGHYVVWQDNRDYIGSSKTRFDVYLYDLDTGEERKINQHSGYNQSVQIQGDHVVWTDNSDTNYNVYFYDIKTGIEKKITNSKAQASGVQIADNQLVWMDGRNGNLDIYTYNMVDGQEKQITSDPSRQTDPKLVGGTVVWHDYRNGVRQIYMYDASGKEKNLSSNTSQPATILSATDGKIVYRLEGAMGRLLVFDPAANKKYQLVGVPTSSDNMLFSNESMYWKSGDKWQLEPIMSHAIPLEDTTFPDAGSDKSWTSIGSEGGTVASPDGQFEITLPRNAGKEAIKLRIQESTQIQQTTGWPWEFQPITSFYTLEKQGKIAGEAVLHFSGIEQWKGKIDTKKVRLFKLDRTEAKWLPIEMPVTKFDGTFRIPGEELATFALGYYQMSFPDLTTHWAKDKVEVLAAHDIIRGYENNEFRPDQTVTRAEFVSLMVRAMKWQSNLRELGNNSFVDVQEHWAEKAIQIASAHGMVHGDHGIFRPDDPITREEMIAMLMRSLQDRHIQTDSGLRLNAFADHSEVSDWARGSLEQAVTMGLIRGKDGRLAPMDNTTRAEAAAVILLSLDKLSL